MAEVVSCIDPSEHVVLIDRGLSRSDSKAKYGSVAAFRMTAREAVCDNGQVRMRKGASEDFWTCCSKTFPHLPHAVLTTSFLYDTTSSRTCG